MKPILYWYPEVHLGEDVLEDSVVVRQHGSIIPYRLEREPYEVKVNTEISSFHLIFGHQVNGMFLCIPDQNIGCGLSELSDRDRNLDSLLKTDRLNYTDSTAIVWALYSINSLLRFIH